LHVTVVVDQANQTPAVAALVESPTLLDTLAKAGHQYRVYDQNHPTIAQKGLKPFVTAAGGPPVIILQTDDGSVIPNGKATKLPATEAGFLDVLRQVGG
jgi:hypothetical protein